MENMEKVCGVARALELLKANKKRNFVVVQFAPAVRVAVGEAFAMYRGEDAAGKIVAALRALGADAVVNSAVAEGAVTLAELKALKERKERGECLPLFSARCTAMRGYLQERLPQAAVAEIPSATEVCARLLKAYYQQATGKRVRVIAVEPCEAKKSESGADVVLTTAELAQVLESLEKNVRLLKKSALDAPLGNGSGAGYICGMSGGIAEAVARCLLTDKTGAALRKLSYSGLYGAKRLREAVVESDGEVWRFAVASGREGVDELLSAIENGANYDYAEITACEGGCICGDGQACDGEMTAKLRGLGLRYLDGKRAARSAVVGACAETLLKKWNALQRAGFEEEIEEEIIEEVEEEIVEEVIEEVIEEVAEEPVEEPAPELETVVEEEIVEEPVQEVQEEIIEEVVEEVQEEIIEEVVEEVQEEIIEEVVEEVQEDIIEEVVEEVQEVDEPAETAEEGVEEVAEEVEQPIEEPVEEVEEPVEEVPEAAEEISEVVEEVEEVAEEIAAADGQDEVNEEVQEVEETEETDEEEEEEFLDEEGKRDPYYVRLSRRDRRKLKRMKKYQRRQDNK